LTPSVSPQEGHARMIRRLLLGAALAIVLLFFFFRGVDGAALARALRAADPVFLGGVVLATLATYLARAWRWGFLLAPLERVPFGRLFSITVIGFMAGLIIPRAGEVLRPYLVAKRYSLRTSAVFASIILERLVDLIAVLLLFGLYFYGLPTPRAQAHGPFLTAVKAGGGLAAVAALAVLGVLLALHHHADRVVGLLERLLGRISARLAAVVVRLLRSFAQGLAVLQASPGHLLAIVGQSILVWLPIAAAIHWSNRALGIDLPFHSTFFMLVPLTAGVAVPTPGMMGGFHVTYQVSLTEVFGVAKQTAAAAGLAAHALLNLPVLALGLALLPREGLSLSRMTRMAESGADESEDPAPRGAPVGRMP
jgi:glycosyltransferase 2 family protein